MRSALTGVPATACRRAKKQAPPIPLGHVTVVVCRLIRIRYSRSVYRERAEGRVAGNRLGEDAANRGVEQIEVRVEHTASGVVVATYLRLRKSFSSSSR
jgi:hypothetical protein